MEGPQKKDYTVPVVEWPQPWFTIGNANDHFFSVYWIDLKVVIGAGSGLFFIVMTFSCLNKFSDKICFDGEDPTE
jgi:uncharacterized membrane protein